jgi:hypothetical protein
LFAKNIAGQHSYQFVDVNATTKAYYRLKQVDKDGKFVYSKTIVLEPKQNQSFVILPNPVKDRVQIKTSQAYKNLQVIDMQGRFVKLFSANANHQYNVSDLAAGQYVIQLLLNDGKVVQEKMSKQ